MWDPVRHAFWYFFGQFIFLKRDRHDSVEMDLPVPYKKNVRPDCHIATHHSVSNHLQTHRHKQPKKIIICLHVFTSMQISLFQDILLVTFFVYDEKSKMAAKTNNFLTETYYMSVTHDLYHFWVCWNELYGQKDV